MSCILNENEHCSFYRDQKNSQAAFEENDNNSFSYTRTKHDLPEAPLQNLSGPPDGRWVYDATPRHTSQ